MFLEVFLEVFEGFEVGVEAFFLRIGDEDHAIRAFQDELPAGLIEHLSRHSI